MTYLTLPPLHIFPHQVQRGKEAAVTENEELKVPSFECACEGRRQCSTYNAGAEIE